MVDVSDFKLTALLDKPELLEALENTEDFRNLKNDIVRVISNEKAIGKLKKDNPEITKNSDLPEKEKKEKDANMSFKKKLRENLLKFVSKIPVFMYLTSDQEANLKDVIEQLETNLFTIVTGLSIQDFEMLCEVGVFNEGYLNESIYSFRRYEDSSLNYLGTKERSLEDTTLYGWDAETQK